MSLLDSVKGYFSRQDAPVKISRRSLVIFSGQLATLVHNGVPIVKALDTLSFQPDDPQFGSVIDTLSRTVSTGSRLSAALKMFPSVFPRVFVAMIAVGEETGGLASVLGRLSVWLEQDDALRRRLGSALSYPMFVLGVSGLYVLLLFQKIMPGFIKIFSDMDVPLPFVTRVVMGFTAALGSIWFWLLIVAGAVLLARGYRNLNATQKGRAFLHRAYSLIPIWGPILITAGHSRYCAAVEVMLDSGMKYINVFQLAATASGSAIIEEDSNGLVNALKEGAQISQYITARPEIYGDTTGALLRAGEESSRVSEMMRYASRFYDLEMASRIDGLAAALEPLMLAGVGLTVGTIVISVFLPMYAYLGKLGI